MTDLPLTIHDRGLEDLALFPLPNVQLFPHTLLPLYVFEQRYRDLVRDCLETRDHALAVPTLQPGFEADYEGRPAIHPVMGAGLIVAANQRDDGTWDIVVRGTDRVRLLTEHPPHARYRTARVARLPETDADDDDPLHARMRLLLAHLGEQAPEARTALGLILSQADTAAELADLVGAHAVSDHALRRRLLETLDVHERLALGCDHLGRLLLEVCGQRTGPGGMH